VPWRRRALTLVPIAVLVVATLGAAGVSMAGTAAAPAPVTRQRTASPLAPPSSTDPNQAAATTEARRLADLVDPDPAWVAVSSPPTPSLTAAPSVPGVADLVDLSLLWTSHDTLDEVRAWVAAHPPAGSVPVGSSASYQRGALVTSGTTSGYGAVPGRLASRQILVTLAPLARGGVGVRVDAQVVWYPTRPPLEAVPSGTTRVTATVFTRAGLSDSAEDVVATKAFTGSRIVGLLAHIVDSLPVAVPGERSCPADGGTAPQLTLDFSGPGHVTSVRVLDDTNGCPTVSFTMGATIEPPLTDDGLFQEVDRLLALSGTVPGEQGQTRVPSSPGSRSVMAPTSTTKSGRSRSAMERDGTLPTRVAPMCS
jgi:hypothetical protein